VNNPEVTVRSRGVMEKCTYCVQRIRNAEIEAEREHANPARPKVRMPDDTIRPVILDGEVKTACQAACPTYAISFGDLNYDQYELPGGSRFSEVARWKTEPTAYGLLAELNTMPRTSYLAAVRNPNPAIPNPAQPTKGA
jgi:Fe-S-cluster-containing dehydrogenase component